MLNRRDFLKTVAGCGVAVFGGPVLGDDKQPERPNILWLTIEDTSYYEFGCYGNKTVKTPNIDSLAEKGIRYTRAWSTAPQCSPARSSLITGCYASRYGMDYHRGRFDTPDGIFYSDFLQQAGYYCTNNYKTDYNTTLSHQAMWDECGRNATYNSKRRKPGQPFFSIFNTGATHMGRVRSFTLEGRRDFSKEGLDPDKLELPEYLPDIEEVRSDYAFHLEGVQDIDKWVGIFLKDLEEKSLADDTIIFFYSDHGGSLPRGKGFLYETGLGVPLVVYVPPKWQHLIDEEPGSVTDRLVGFVDFAPTIMSLIGIKKPDFMQGKAFLGKSREPAREYQFGFRCNQYPHYDPARAVTDGKYKYIRNYIPHKPYSLRNFYQWGMPANLGWDEYVLEGGSNPKLLRPYEPKAVEMLFDIEKDPMEVSNLAGKPQFSEKLGSLREVLSAHIRQIADLGFFPETTREKDTDLYSWVRKNDYPLEQLHNAVEKASQGHASFAKDFIDYLKSEHASKRFWGAVGFCQIAAGGNFGPDKCPAELVESVKDKNAQVAAMAAEGCCYFRNYQAGLGYLLEGLFNEDRHAFASLETMTWYPGQAEQLLRHKEQLQSHKDLLFVRAILVNLRLLPVSELYSEAEKKEGIKVNRNRRNLVPRP